MGKEPVKSRLAGYVRQQALERITESHWASIQAEFPDTSPGYLRRLLRDSGLPLAPFVEGVRQSTLPDLERTLLALEREYSAATAAQDRARATTCRTLAIEARNRARWIARKTANAAKRAEKEEALAWLQTWLEYPPAFPTWVTLRKRVLLDTEDTGDTE